MIEEVKKLRQLLHKTPRLSGQEQDTVDLLGVFLRTRTSLEVHQEENRLWCIHREPGALETVAFRADTDAIPGPDGAAFHGCGHDGHSAMLAGLALRLEGKRLGKNVLLLFQPAEEIGAGAKPFRDSLLEREKIDRIYGLHNLPGFPEGVIMSHPGTFACASRGFSAEVIGCQSHAAYPEQGKNPAHLLSRAVTLLPQFEDEAKGADFDGLLLSTVVELRVGAQNFGVSAGEGRLSLTLRSTRLEALERLEDRIRSFLTSGCEAEGMTLRCTVQDDFPDTVSDDALLADARQRWTAMGLPQGTLEEPMRWSEDFGWYLKKIPGVFFGLGAGETWAGLHTPDYEFNDAVLERGIEAFWSLI